MGQSTCPKYSSGAFRSFRVIWAEHINVTKNKGQLQCCNRQNNEICITVRGKAALKIENQYCRIATQKTKSPCKQISSSLIQFVIKVDQICGQFYARYYDLAYFGNTITSLFCNILNSSLCESLYSLWNNVKS